MIVICGDLVDRSRPGPVATAVARRAAASGATAQVVGIVPDGAAGDRLLLELARDGLGHAAVLREPARDLEAADLDLALRYLPGVRVIVVVAMPASVVQAAVDHADWSGLQLIVVRAADRDESLEPAGSAGDRGASQLAIVLEAPARDPDGTFAGFVGALAARLDDGATPADAWAETTRELAVDPV